jgi:hypothetical protein
LKTVALNIADVGVVTFKESRRARRLNIRIRPFAGVCVSVPAGISFSAAQDFVHQQKAWIAKHLVKARADEERRIIYDGGREISTRFHKLDVQCKSRDSRGIHVRIANGIVHVRYPANLPLRSQQVQTAIATGLIAAYRIEAKRYLPALLKSLAQQHGFTFERVFIKNHKSRWGSCSSQNNINLSLHLMRLPDHLIDYVLLHELAHTRIKNHSQKFWNLLESVYHGARTADKKLRKVERELAPLHI